MRIGVAKEHFKDFVVIWRGVESTQKIYIYLAAVSHEHMFSWGNKTKTQSSGTAKEESK